MGALDKFGKFIGLFSSIIHIVIGASAFANNRVDLMYQILKDTKEDYLKVGTICEQVAKVELESMYRLPEYEVQTGIVYQDENHILGELDAVVFHRASKKAILAAEVKCWRDQDKALKKAHRQLLNFKSNLSSSVPLDFYLSTDRSIHYDRAQFGKETFLVPVSYRGSGFIFSLDYTLSELLELREKILKHQGIRPSKRIKTVAETN